MAATLVSCAAPKATITATKDGSYADEPRRLIVIESIGDELGRYRESFRSTLSQRLTDCGVAVDFTTRPARDPLALDNSAEQRQRQEENEKIHASSADAVLQIVQVSVVRTESIPPQVRQIGYQLLLTDVRTARPVWKASVQLFTGFDIVTVHDPGITLADDIKMKLVQDGILRSCSGLNAS